MEGAILDGIPQHAISWLMRLIDARAPSVGAIECSLNMGSMSLRSEKTLQSSTLLAVTRDGPEFAYGTVHSLGSANVDLYFPVERICPQMREGRFVLDVRGLHPVLYESYIFEDASLLLLKSTSNRYGEILKELHVLKGEFELSKVPRGLENEGLAWFYLGILLKVDRTLDSRVWGLQRANFQKSP
ncbi:hypothetical protein NDN08_002640 [Rhodosorus marinus]|uniref:Uncharacterized protein n=1 Tax=Rhodosorus marinus TaxID=101924 RepID=A0AAV8UUB3_9RHOD|nr:hypothetical protein NDN08_002640 [Rhodosorus marinus]